MDSTGEYSVPHVADIEIPTSREPGSTSIETTDGTTPYTTGGTYDHQGSLVQRFNMLGTVSTGV